MLQNANKDETKLIDDIKLCINYVFGFNGFRNHMYKVGLKFTFKK